MLWRHPNSSGCSRVTICSRCRRGRRLPGRKTLNRASARCGTRCCGNERPWTAHGRCRSVWERRVSPSGRHRTVGDPPLRIGQPRLVAREHHTGFGADPARRGRHCLRPWWGGRWPWCGRWCRGRCRCRLGHPRTASNHQCGGQRCGGGALHRVGDVLPGAHIYPQRRDRDMTPI
jgi:hypothetical protein